MIVLNKQYPIVLSIALIFLTTYSTYSQTNPTGTYFSAPYFINYLESHPREKAYLQTDRNLYLAGDTMYFKAYVTLGESSILSNLSGVLYVQLLGPKNRIESSVTLLLKNGMAYGEFNLLRNLTGGIYHLKAYTQWMKNGGPDSFFDQELQVYSLEKSQYIPVVDKHSSTDIDIQFLPEGGNLVNGIVSKVAFRAVGSNGLGRDIKGSILDDKGKIISHFSSLHLGMGHFFLKPESGRSYKAVLELNQGTKKAFPIPAAVDQGIALSVDNDSLPKAIVKIRANQAFYTTNKGENLSLIIQDHGKITTVNCRLDSQIVSFTILKRHLHSGVATVTLFSKQNEPLCERRFFVQNYDGLNINLTTDKSTYSYGEQLNLAMNVKNRADSAVAGYFSVSIVNENSLKAPDDIENIHSYLLLTSDMKGYIEQPGYYFSDITDQKLKDLDLVMLTHGYSGFEWKNIAENKPNLIVAETGLEISGQLKNVQGKPVEKGTVTLIPKDGGTVLKTSSDDKGRFSFKNLIFYDSTRFVLSAINSKGNNNIKLFYHNEDDSFLMPQQVIQVQGSSLVGTRLSDTLVSKYFEKQIAYQLSKNTIQLKEVQVKGVKQDKQYVTQSLAGAGNADQVMHAEEIEKIQGSLVSSLNGRLRGVIFNGGDRGIPFLTVNMNGLNGVHPMLVIIDGAEVPATSVNNLTVNEVETVEVLKYSSTTIYGMNGGNGVLLITTKQGGGRELKDISSTGVLPIMAKGFYVSRKFYSPKYNASQSDFATNLRSTIYWKSDIQTDLQGNASFSCYNLGLKGNYRVTIEGIDKSGNVGTKVIHYKLN